METKYDPRKEYIARLNARETAAKQLDTFENRIANARLVVFLAGLALLWLAYAFEAVSYWWLAVPAAVFIGLMIQHELTLRKKAAANAAVTYYRRAIARLDGDWIGQGATGDDVFPQDHIFARDLDLYGEGSVFELLCAARTKAGEQALADWLAAPANPATVRDRQEAVEELRHKLDLREELALHGDDIRDRVHPGTLVQWAEGPRIFGSPALRIAAIVFAALGLAGIGTWYVTGMFGAFVLVFAIELMFLGRYRQVLFHIDNAVSEPKRELGVLAEILTQFEQEKFESRLLRALQSQLISEHATASQCVRRLDKLAYLMEAPRNPIFAPFAIILMWPIHAAMAIEHWREHFGGHVRHWLDAVGALEALCSLATFAYEHPGDPFPEVIDDGPLFDGEAFAHPLLHENIAVRNDVRLDRDNPLIIITGSNMSGKSTLLRAVGVNTALALAGAPVRAANLRVAPMALGANMRVEDSIQEGKSRFFAEIVRLKAIMDKAGGDLPVLFLLDELLHGTNSHDRRIGAEGVVRELLDRGAIGFVTSHDLALTDIADTLGPQARNNHLQDQVINGELHFDYKLRDGVVQKSNALRLMRTVGLDVREE